MLSIALYSVYEILSFYWCLPYPLALTRGIGGEGRRVKWNYIFLSFLRLYPGIYFFVRKFLNGCFKTSFIIALFKQKTNVEFMDSCEYFFKLT